MKNKPFKMVVFDMAGTTVDEHNLVYKTIHKVLVDSGYEVPFETVLNIGAGKEKFQALTDILHAAQYSISIEVLSQVYHRFLNELSIAYERFPVSAFSDADEVFNILRKQKIFVVLNTGYNRSVAELLLEKLQWRQLVHYDLLVTASEVTHCRPAPDMIIRAMQLLKIKDPLTVIKVGDSCADILEGHEAKCGLVVGITTGAQRREQLNKANPHFIIDSLSELLNFL